MILLATRFKIFLRELIPSFEEVVSFGYFRHVTLALFIVLSSHFL